MTDPPCTSINQQNLSLCSRITCIINMYVQHVTICNVNPRISGLVCFIQIYTVYQYKPLN